MRAFDDARQGERMRYGGTRGDLQARGAGLSAGVGLEYFVNPTLAVEGGLSWSFGKFSEGRQGTDEWKHFGDASFSATSARFDIGLSWHP